MLLDPNDYDYRYFKQKRGKEGDSGLIYFGKPKLKELCPILVKSYDLTDAINEYIGCNVARRIGVNAPRAWLFERWYPDFDKLDFEKAVAIEYLDFSKESGDEFDDNEKLAKQSIKCAIFHRLMYEREDTSYAIVNGDVFTFDFANGMLPQYFVGTNNSEKRYNGFTKLGYEIMKWQHDSRKNAIDYLKKKEAQGEYKGLATSAYMELRERFIEEYNNNEFLDLIADILEAFGVEYAHVAAIMIDSMQQALVAF